MRKKKQKYKDEDVREMLEHSNWIEGVSGDIPLSDAVKAWEYAIKSRVTHTTRYILKIHKLLALRSNKRIAGKFRQCDVWIGGVKKMYISN